MFKSVIEGALPKAGWLQLFAGESANPNPGQAGNPGGSADPNQQPKTYTEEELQARIKAEVKKAADTAAANARRAVEGEYKPKLDAANQALDSARPFLENPTQYMAQYLATNPAMIQTVADLTDRMMKGELPTKAQIAAVGKAADDATDPRVQKKLEELEKKLTASQENAEEERQLASEMKAFGKQFTDAGLKWDPDAFTAYVNKYADENELGDDDTIDTKALFRAYLAEQKLEAGKPRPPKLPGGSGAAPTPGGNPRPKNWDEASVQAEARLKAAAQD